VSSPWWEKWRDGSRGKDGKDAASMPGREGRGGGSARIWTHEYGRNQDESPNPAEVSQWVNQRRRQQDPDAFFSPKKTRSTQDALRIVKSLERSPSQSSQPTTASTTTGPMSHYSGSPPITRSKVAAVTSVPALLLPLPPPHSNSTRTPTPRQARTAAKDGPLIPRRAEDQEEEEEEGTGLEPLQTTPSSVDWPALSYSYTLDESATGEGEPVWKKRLRNNEMSAKVYNGSNNATKTGNKSATNKKNNKSSNPTSTDDQRKRDSTDSIFEDGSIRPMRSISVSKTASFDTSLSDQISASAPPPPVPRKDAERPVVGPSSTTPGSKAIPRKEMTTPKKQRPSQKTEEPYSISGRTSGSSVSGLSSSVSNGFFPKLRRMERSVDATAPSLVSVTEDSSTVVDDDTETTTTSSSTDDIANGLLDPMSCRPQSRSRRRNSSSSNNSINKRSRSKARASTTSSTRKDKSTRVETSEDNDEYSYYYDDDYEDPQVGGGSCFDEDANFADKFDLFAMFILGEASCSTCIHGEENGMMDDEISEGTGLFGSQREYRQRANRSKIIKKNNKKKKTRKGSSNSKGGSSCSSSRRRMRT